MEVPAETPKLKPKPKPKPKPYTRRRRHKKKKPVRKNLKKGEYPMKQILQKATTSSRVHYYIDWDMPKGTKKNWIDYSNLLPSLPTMKEFDKNMAKSGLSYFEFASKYLPQINEKDLAEQRKHLEDKESVSRIVAYLPESNTALIYWENGCISKVNLNKVKDVQLQRAIGAVLLKENKWTVESYMEIAFGEKFKLWEDEEDPEDSEQPEEQQIEINYAPDEFPPNFDWEGLYELYFRKFETTISKYWTLYMAPADDSGSEVLVMLNPFFPADDDTTGREPHIAACSHTICSNCGRIFSAPEADFINHIIVTNHIGWHVACLVDTNELDGIRKAAKKSIQIREDHLAAKSARLTDRRNNKLKNRRVAGFLIQKKAKKTAKLSEPTFKVPAAVTGKSIFKKKSAESKDPTFKVPAAVSGKSIFKKTSKVSAKRTSKKEKKKVGDKTAKKKKISKQSASSKFSISTKLETDNVVSETNVEDFSNFCANSSASGSSSSAQAPVSLPADGKTITYADFDYGDYSDSD